MSFAPGRAGVNAHGQARTAKSSRLTDVFFRHMVGNMRNGVLAIARDGGVVLVNDEACRLFGLPPGPTLVGLPVRRRPARTTLTSSASWAARSKWRRCPIARSCGSSPPTRCIGYTLSLVRDEAGTTVGAALFFKDLTHVEQMEERERLRDRLAAVGEMAAVMAHEIKNPLAAHRGAWPGCSAARRRDNEDVQSLVKDIISEAKMANAIVQEVLAFVRPVRLQVDRTSLAEALASAVLLADGKASRGNILVEMSAARRAAARSAPTSTS